MIERDIGVCMGAYEILMELNREFAEMYKICIQIHVRKRHVEKQHGS